MGHYTSIAIDSNDAVHISYYDLASKDLKYATCSRVVHLRAIGTMFLLTQQVM